jgi:hypothetical protein
MARELSDWITAYQEYTLETESAAIFHKWTAISVLAAVLRRKVWFNFGRIKIFPNLFVVFVAEPGVARKTQAISFGEELLSNISGVAIAADTSTPQALLDDLEEAVTATLMPDSTNFSHSSLTIFSGEFESFLGDKKENARMLVILTDLFDCKQRPYRTRTRHSGSNEIPSPFLNMLAATTPESLANSLPSTAIGGGLTSRIIFVWAEGRRKKIDVPEKPPSRIKDALVKDLAVISRIAGAYNFTGDGRAWWKKWYASYEENDPKRICKDPAFRGWYSRKPLFIIKLAVIIAASRAGSGELVITPEYLEAALETLEEAERTMTKTFSAVGRSSVTADVELVRSLLQQHKVLSENTLLQMVWRDIDSKKFDTVIHTILRSGEARRTYVGPKGEKGIYYYWVGVGGC